MSVEPITKAKSTKRNLQDEASQAIEFLNRKARRNFRPTQVNLNFCIARLREGYTLQELKIVVVMKCREWLTDDRMAEFLRPATLFNCQNFNQYAGMITGDVPTDDREISDDYDLS